MANKREIQIEYKAQNAEFNKSIKEINSEITTLNKEFRLHDEQLRSTSKGTERLENQYGKLNKELELVQKKVQVANEKYQNAVKTWGEGSEEAKRTYNSLLDVQRQEERLKNAIEDTNKRIQEQGSKFNKLGDSLDNAGEKMKTVGDKISGVGRNMMIGVTTPLAAIGTAGFKLAADIEDSLGAVDQIFGKSSDSIKDWAEELPAYYGVNKKEALEYSTIMGSLLQNIGGMNQDEAAKMSASLTELGSDLSAMFVGTPESAINSLTQALKGNYATLENYGMGITAAAVSQRALEMGLADTVGQLTQQDRQVAALDMIWEQTTKTQGQARREADSSSGVLKALTVTLKDLTATIGQVLLPILTPLLEKLKNWLQRFKELDSATQQQIVKMAMFAAAIGPVLLVIGKITSGIGSIVTAGGSLFKWLDKASKALAAAGSSLGKVALSISGIIAIIGALVGAFVYLWQTNEDFRNKIVEIWGNIKGAFEQLCSGIVERLNALGLEFESITEVFKAIWQAFTDFLAPIFEGAFNLIAIVFQGFVDVFFGIWDAFSALFQGNWEGFWNGISAILTGIWNAIVALFENALNTIKGIMDVFLGWFGTSTENVFNRVGTFISNIWNGIKNTISNTVNAIQSSIGGAWDWIITKTTNVWNGIKSAIMTPVNWVKDKLAGAVNAIKGLFNFKFTWPHIPLPHFSISGSLNPINWLKDGLPRIGVEWYAKGGILNQPTIIGATTDSLRVGGEAGPEAVIPLNAKVLGQIGQGIVNSTAELINSRTASAQPIVYVTMNNQIANSYDSQKAIRELNRELGRLGVIQERGRGRA